MFISTAALSGRYHQVLVHHLSLVIHVVLQQNAYVYNYWGYVWSLPPGPRIPSLSRDPFHCNRMDMFISTGAVSAGHHQQVLVHRLSLVIHMFIGTGAASGHYHQVLVYLLCLVIHVVLQQNSYVY